jgi:hypothetical protein
MLAFLGDLGLPELVVMAVIALLVFGKDSDSPSDGSATGCCRAGGSRGDRGVTIRPPPIR